MEAIDLLFTKELRERLKDDRPLIQVILGPRQVGKTTTVQRFLEKNFKTTQYVYETSETGSADALWLEQMWQATREEKILVIDEIQKIHNWSETVKKLWDENKRKKIPTKLILLGSSSLDIQKGLSESLTGRFELIRAWHWSLEESNDGYQLQPEIFYKYGGYPASYGFIKNKTRWSHYINDSIIDTVLNKDILTQAKVKSPALFRQAFYMMISYPAQEISFNKMLGQLQDKGNIDLVKYYLTLFEGAYLLKGIYKYSDRPITTKQSSPKIVVMSSALANADLKKIDDSEYQGRVFESLVGATLLRAGFELFYWRQKNFEVDYVIEFKNQLIGIEVKSGRAKNSKGLAEFRKLYPNSQALFITKENFPQFSKNPEGFLKKYL